LGVGLGIGVPAGLALLATVGYLLRKRQKDQKEIAILKGLMPHRQPQPVHEMDGVRQNKYPMSQGPVAQTPVMPATPMEPVEADSRHLSQHR
jgi:hypothetical protein